MNPPPTIEALGVHRLEVTEELFREQLAILYGAHPLPEHRVHIRQQLESTVLVEVFVRHRDARFRVDDFTQSQDGVARDNWQAPWAEAYLTADGSSLAVERWSPAPPSGDLRIAFFVHDWRAGQPLLSSYGPVDCPPPAEMTDRLRRLVPYEPVD